VSNDVKAKLLTSRMPTDEVEIPGVGTVTVRGLSRGEVFAIRKVANGDQDVERKTLARAMVEPEFTEDEAGQWQAASPAGELEPVTKRIQELSGLAEGADKSGVPEVRGDA
jgi:hypothetical protein